MAQPSYQPVEPALSGVRNFRDVGGLPTPDGRRVRTGRLFRSGHLAHATPADRDVLAGLGLHTVFDFRNASDQALEGPDAELPGVRNVNIPLSDASHSDEFWRTVRTGTPEELRAALSDGAAEAQMRATYRAMVRTRTAEHGRVLRALADGALPALLHCSAGKDRAGITVAVVLLALGVERETITEDYLMSNAPHRRYRLVRDDDAQDARSEAVNELLAPLFDARAAYLEAAFAQIDETWGGSARYLAEGLAFPPADQDRLRGTLLTGS